MGPVAQILACTSTPRGRLVVFPNTVHHHHICLLASNNNKNNDDDHSPQAKPEGRLSVLAMYLVDPHIRILSTANVAPQQRDSWAHAVWRAAIPRLCDLPREVFNMIIEYVEGGDSPISPREALAVRYRMKRERILFEKKMGEMIGWAR